MKQLFLDSKISEVPGIGEKYANKLNKLAIATIEDFLYHFPSRHEDRQKIYLINEAPCNKIVVVSGQITQLENIYSPRGKKLQKGLLTDSSGSLEITWFNQPFLVNTLRGKRVNLVGKIEQDYYTGALKMIPIDYEILGWHGGMLIHSGRLVPIYPETAGLSSKWIRSKIAYIFPKILNQIEDSLSSDMRQKYKLIRLPQALSNIHFPQDLKSLEMAKERLAFDEMLSIQLKAQKRRIALRKNKPIMIIGRKKSKVLIQKFIGSLPYKLTSGQIRAIEEISADIASGRPMNRLVQGDVGCGKTVVAAAFIYLAAKNKIGSMLMAPTQILAKQHAEILSKLLKPFKIQVKLVLGGEGGGQLKNKTKTGKVVVGTHALIKNKLKFDDIGLIVIDEQHKFGVKQRASLVEKGIAPHVINISATPIPRSLALTLYGDQDLSIIDEMPPGRRPVKTWLVPKNKRNSAYQWIGEQIKKKKNTQVFVVCPLIEESEHETMKSVKSVKIEFERLRTEIFPDFRVGLLHGKMKTEEKDKIVNKLRSHDLDILVATSLIEVGIDVPSVDIIIIEGAERFGLAQLHQMRGRVGRAGQQGYCLLFTNKENPFIKSRLKILEREKSGMKIAEYDLVRRGQGEVYGLRQHGFIDLKIASFMDLDLIKKTRRAAYKLLNSPN